MAAKGDILLNLPKESGWSLIAKSTKGRVVVDKQEPKLEELKNRRQARYTVMPEEARLLTHMWITVKYICKAIKAIPGRTIYV